MAFKTEEDKLAYEAKMQKFYASMPLSPIDIHRASTPGANLVHIASNGVAFGTEEAKLAYESERRKSAAQAEIVRTAPPRLSEGQIVNLHTDMNTIGSGGIAFIIIGIPLLLIPPVGITLIGLGIASLMQAGRQAVTLGSHSVDN